MQQFVKTVFPASQNPLLQTAPAPNLSWQVAAIRHGTPLPSDSTGTVNTHKHWVNDRYLTTTAVAELVHVVIVVVIVTAVVVVIVTAVVVVVVAAVSLHGEVLKVVVLVAIVVVVVVAVVVVVGLMLVEQQ
ncbi:hypothetical protein ElyMa_000651700 [Elysia marginata]|uniref:ABC transmembrane type-1 domain-containing protein n=1 Tax=Elysia marginata TaxID=1093978 RepID=A0AAV4GFS9_9GAST|nr:hypothetical protein ElyMa_000651700 [Elysia marginata]